MKIIAHRGVWRNSQQQNSLVAFNKALSLNAGIETDIRDCQQKLVISHDMAQATSLQLTHVLAELKSLLTQQHTLALNIKADGLAFSLKKILTRYSNLDYFAFDMSIPDAKQYLAAGIPMFTRLSEIEPSPLLFDEAAGIWLDSFSNNWFNATTITDLLKQNKRVCIVSAELHQRDYLPIWQLLKPLKNNDQLLLCTDLVEEAFQFFYLL